MEHIAQHQRKSAAAAAIKVFQYPGSAEPTRSAWAGWGGLEEAEGGTTEFTPPGDDPPEESAERSMNAACEALLAKETQRSFEEGRARGYREGRADERAAFEAQAKAGETERIAHAARLTESIHAERTRHLEAVEHEVVKLAMAIAARILRREAQVDRLLLTGAVRVALGQLSASSQVRLKVPAADLDLWTESIALLPNLAVKPVVVAGEGMRLGDCVAETEVGSVDLGVKAQLGEIEHALFKGASGGAAPAATSAAGGEEEK